MRNFKLLVLLLMIIGGMHLTQAQRSVVRVYPKHGTVVTKINRPAKFVFNNINYHFAEGIWYRARGRKFVVAAPPVGLRVRTLPRGNKVVVINGRKLYKYKGVWYKKSGRHYTIVTV